MATTAGVHFAGVPTKGKIAERDVSGIGARVREVECRVFLGHERLPRYASSRVYILVV